LTTILGPELPPGTVDCESNRQSAESRLACSSVAPGFVHPSDADEAQTGERSDHDQDPGREWRAHTAILSPASALSQLAGIVSTGAGAFSPVSASVMRIRRNVNTPLDLRSRFSIQYQ